MSILRGLCKMLWYCSILFILNQSIYYIIYRLYNNVYWICVKCLGHKIYHEYTISGIDRILSTKTEVKSPTPPPAHQGISASRSDVILSTNKDGHVTGTKDIRTVDIDGLDLPDGMRCSHFIQILILYCYFPGRENGRLENILLREGLPTTISWLFPYRPILFMSFIEYYILCPRSKRGERAFCDRGGKVCSMDKFLPFLF